MTRVTSDILIAGGGAAGLAAAVSASASGGKRVTLVDDNPRLGGQIWRAELGKTKSVRAQKLIEALETQEVKIVNNARIFASQSVNSLLAETPSGTVEFEYEKLIIATGARERFLPFPGWTLPHVFGAGGLQALVKSGLQVGGKRIIIAGTGPLLLAVAEYLNGKGANIVAIAEQAPQSKLNRLALSLLLHPAKAVQAAALRTKLLGVKYLTDCWVISAAGSERLETVNLQRKGKTWSVDCDLLASGFHLVPNLELASIVGCRIEGGFVAVDEFQRTSCENVFCAGEPTGIGGVESSLIEGTIAGFAATGAERNARATFAARYKANSFEAALNHAFELRDDLKGLADAATLVCRCEDVEFGQLQEFDSWRSAKLQTRCGMGPCQARVCGAAAEFLFDWTVDAARPPIFPVTMENL